jgi:3-oxoacyl-[acyl-carrier protein] reductase
MSARIDLAGRVALVTGASRGCGARIAVALGAAGARVALHYGTSREKAGAVAAEAEAAGAPATLLVKAELADESERSALLRTVAERLGPPLIHVHNAGIYVRNPFDEADAPTYLRRWRRTLAVNLESNAHLIHLGLPAMRAARWGRIVLISSRAAFRGETDCADYAVSKAGQVSLARCLARAEGPYGITANAVCPGWVDTEMAQPDLSRDGERIRAEVPLGRVATAQDVANAVLFLVSEMGSYVNGAALPLNGGSYLH